MVDSTNRFAVRATIQATSRMNTRFTVQKYLRKKSSITRPGSLQGIEQARCHPRGSGQPVPYGQVLEIIPGQSYIWGRRRTGFRGLDILSKPGGGGCDGLS